MSEQVKDREFTREDFCSYCPYCKLGDIYYCPECDDEERDLYCEKLEKFVYKGLCWNEIAATHRRADGVESGMDMIPENCPLGKASSRPQTKPVFHPHVGEFDHLFLYDKYGILLAQVRTEEELLDFRKQVKDLNAEGYYLLDHGVKKEILTNGTIYPPVEVFSMEMLEHLIGS